MSNVPGIGTTIEEVENSIAKIVEVHDTAIIDLQKADLNDSAKVALARARLAPLKASFDLLKAVHLQRQAFAVAEASGTSKLTTTQENARFYLGLVIQALLGCFVLGLMIASGNALWKLKPFTAFEPLLIARVGLGLMGLSISFAIALVCLGRAETAAAPTSSEDSAFEFGGVRLNFGGGGPAFVSALALVVVVLCCTSLGWQGPASPASNSLAPIVHSAKCAGVNSTTVVAALYGEDFGNGGVLIYSVDGDSTWKVVPEKSWQGKEITFEYAANHTLQMQLVRKLPPAASHPFSLSTKI